MLFNNSCQLEIPKRAWGGGGVGEGGGGGVGEGGAGGGRWTFG